MLPRTVISSAWSTFYLIDHDRADIVPRFLNKYGRSVETMRFAIHAARRESIRCIKVIPADDNKNDRYEMLTCAAQNNNLSMLRWLYKYGAEHIVATTETAAAFGSADCLKYELANGHPLNFRGLLNYAIRHEQFESYDIIVRHLDLDGLTCAQSRVYILCRGIRSHNSKKSKESFLTSYTDKL